jgi:Putative DNA-binding domain
MAERPSLAEELFEKIKNQSDPTAFLKAMTDSASPTFESDYLDFKAKPDPDPKNSKLKEIWYEALSGFGNSGGGVLVWGIDARKDSTTGIDSACAVKPIQNPNGFKSLLIELQRGATDPPLGNVKIETWESSPGEGFVVCLIPSGPFKPYRAEVSGKKQFFMRSADSFYVPSVSVIRSLFYPQSHAVFQVQVNLTWNLGLKEEPCPDRARFSCDTYIHNQGTATARDAFIILQTNLNHLGPLSDNEVWHILDSSPKRMQFEAKRPIHPDVTVNLGRLEWQTSTSTAFGAQNRVVPLMVENRFIFYFHSEDQAPQRAEIIFDGEDLTRANSTYSKTVTASDV